MIYAIWRIVKWADTECVPPAIVVIVRAVELPAGLITANTELTDDVVTNEIPTIWLVPVALPTTEFAIKDAFNVNANCPASLTLTWNNTW